MPVALGLLIASLLYMLIMPTLSSFAELGALIFIYALAVGYRYYAPQETLARLLVMFIFGGLVGISNDQAYTFGPISNNVLTWTWVLIMLHASTLLPIRIRPETRFLRLLERFNLSVASLQAEDVAGGWLRLWVRAYHRHEILTILNKLALWQPHLPPNLVKPVGADLDTLLQSVKDCQTGLLQTSATEQVTPGVAEFERQHAVINWAPWREPRF
jgi:hypothetical protein